MEVEGSETELAAAAVAAGVAVERVEMLAFGGFVAGVKEFWDDEKGLKKVLVLVTFAGQQQTQENAEGSLSEVLFRPTPWAN